MTVGIAVICRFQYSEKEIGFAILGATDRMLTHGDVQFEPPQLKFGSLDKRITVVTAGEVHIHAEALRATQRNLETEPSDDVNAVAEAYAANFRAAALRISAQRYLSPHGLDEVSFLSAQHSMNSELVLQLADKMARCDTDAEAMVVGIDSKGSPHLYYISPQGIATCHSDEGFITIGIGGSLARLQLMLAGYSQYAFGYFEAMATLYAAKRSAETAPGVGKSTDIFLITRESSEIIVQQTMKALSEVYTAYEKKRAKLAANAIVLLREKVVNKTPRNPSMKSPSPPPEAAKET